MYFFKKVLLLSVSMVLFSLSAQASETCFIAKENGKILKSEGNCSLRLPPGCDFSIFLSIIGFDSGVLKDENNPEWSYNGEEAFLNAWKKRHTPRTWIVDSCVWYSGNIVEKVGFEKIKEYVTKFQYGNQDVTGINKSDWPGDLQVSPEEQVEFLQKLVNKKLPVSDHAYQMTEKVLFIQDFIGGWKLYGKTGVGEGVGEERTGWFIGWIAKDKRRIPFVSSIVLRKKQDKIPSFIARSNAMEKLFWLINELEHPNKG